MGFQCGGAASSLVLSSDHGVSRRVMSSVMYQNSGRFAVSADGYYLIPSRISE